MDESLEYPAYENFGSALVKSYTIDSLLKIYAS